MKNRGEIYDVFLSFSAEKMAAAMKVEARLVELGLTVFTPLRLLPGQNVAERLREELGGSLSVVVLLGPREMMSSTMAVEVGAALAWKKPVFAVSENPSQMRSGALPVEVRVIGERDVPVIAEELRIGSRPFTDKEREVLTRIYSEISIPTDQLFRSPAALGELAERFNKASRTRWSGERLLREIIVMRKRGRLPKFRRNSKAAEIVQANVG